MSNIALPYTFAASTVIRSAEVNASLSEIATKFNTFAVQTDVARTITVSHTQAADLLFADNLYDIGKSGATRPRDGFFSRNIVVAGTLAVGSPATFSSSATFAGSVSAGAGVAVGGALTGATTGAFSSNVTVGGTLAVTGTTTLTGTVTAQGQLFSQNSIIAGFGGAASSNTAFASPYIGVGDAANGKNLAMQMNASFGADWWYFPGNVKLMTLSNSGNLGVFGTLAVSGLATINSALVTGNTVAFRVQNGFSAVPAGSSGVGIELAGGASDGYVYSFNRTTNTAAPMLLLASDFSFTGPATFSGNVTTATGAMSAAGFYTYSASFSAVSGVTYSAGSVSGAAGLYIVYMYLASGSPANYTALAHVLYDGTAARIVQATDGSNLFISLSGTSIQVMQNSGSTSSLFIRWQKISS